MGAVLASTASVIDQLFPVDGTPEGGPAHPKITSTGTPDALSPFDSRIAGWARALSIPGPRGAAPGS
ncbi:hypothetical protein [Parafrankia sp. EUN1f]|uniref:hypothetical protein n=1 Tax=Parafrankia sp. EUN1f TaxID=102897 RepID=UPI0001C44E7A|nr:hypothetical protein [Parafrankia sp. EUN1f]EFC82886.1 hypothetical protein FrEUN1fDRAFT_3995 [Parafrankia sp. EUN1f]